MTADRFLTYNPFVVSGRESGSPMSGKVNEQSETFEREELVRALQARERFLTGVIGSLESFVTVDEDWRLTYTNAAAERLAGLDDRPLVGRDLRDLTPASVLVQALPKLDEAMLERTVVELDVSDEGSGGVFHIRACPLGRRRTRAVRERRDGARTR